MTIKQVYQTWCDVCMKKDDFTDFAQRLVIDNLRKKRWIRKLGKDICPVCSKNYLSDTGSGNGHGTRNAGSW